MCGLACLISWDGPADRAALDRSLRLLRHRGPDGEGVHGAWAGALLLGHRRLAIFDPTSAGAQPMIDPESGDALIFNGAIYNFPELRAELEAAGHRFRTETDTEVILAAYRRWGTDGFARFNGMWAFALLDAARDMVVLSRDRLGVKPLYFAHDGRRFGAASEIRATGALLGLEPRADRQAVHDFLIAGDAGLDGATCFAGIVELPPGAAWKVRRGGRIERGRYHDWDDRAAGAPLGDEELRALLADATRLRLRSDAPTVSLLSGGLDSSIVAWSIASTERERRTRLAGLVTYGYEAASEARYDESARAGEVVAMLPAPIEHRVHRAASRPDHEELAALVDAQEQPFTTPSLLAGFRTYRMLAGQGIKVALTGEGSDELFGGYTALYANFAARDRLLAGDLAGAWRLARSPHASPGGTAGRLLWHLPVPAVRAILRRHRPNARSMAPELWREGRERFAEIAALRRRPLAERLRRDVVRDLLPRALHYADRSSMASAIELRAPFLDHRLVARALALPPEAKLSAAGGKLPLRRAYAGRLPESVLGAPKSHGFGQAEQFQVGHMDLGDLLATPPRAAEGLIDVARLAEEMARRPGDPLLWWPVSVLLWLDRLERPGS